MGGRSGQSIGRGSAGRAGGFTGAPYSQATVNAFANLKSLTPTNALQMAGIPLDITGRVDIYQINNIVYVDYDNEGLTMQRRINTKDKEVRNRYFKITNNSRFKGRGLEIFESQVNKLRREGYKKIITQADGSKRDDKNGYYTWAVFGYMPVYAESQVNFLNIKAGTNYTNWLDIVRTRSGAALWKEHGSGFEGTFDLSNNSESMKTLRAYSKYRRSQNR